MKMHLEPGAIDFLFKRKRIKKDLGKQCHCAFCSSISNSMDIQSLFIGLCNTLNAPKAKENFNFSPSRPYFIASSVAAMLT